MAVQVSYPGVYIEEFAPGAPIQGVGTSTAAFLGPAALGPLLLRAARQFPALIVTGPRRAGKTTLLRRAFPAASYHLLEDPDVIARVRADPRGFTTRRPRCQ